MINQSVRATSECGPEVKCIFMHDEAKQKEERKEGRKVESVYGFAHIRPFFSSDFSINRFNCKLNFPYLSTVTMRSRLQT